MIRSVKNIAGFTIAATDGTIGEVKNAFFDDSEWAIRYLVVETGSWLTGRKVLVSPLFISDVDWGSSAVRVTLSRDQVKDSPDVDFDKPVSRQQEAEYYRHYRSFGYWGGPFVWGQLPYPSADMSGTNLPEEVDTRVRRDARHSEDSHLRSADEVEGYDIQALDGSIGHVEDFLFDDQTWLIEFMVVDTRNWLPGKQVMIPPTWVDEVDWFQSVAHIGASRETIRERPEYPWELASRGTRDKLRSWQQGNDQHRQNSS